MSYVYRALGESDAGRQASFAWLQANYDAIKTYFDSTFASTVNEITKAYANGGKTQVQNIILGTTNTSAFQAFKRVMMAHCYEFSWAKYR